MVIYHFDTLKIADDSPEMKTVWKRLIEMLENDPTDFPEGKTKRNSATADLPVGNTKK